MGLLNLNPGTTECVLIWLAAMLIAAVSQVLMKLSANRGYKSRIREYANFYLVAAYGLAVVSLFLTNLAFTKLDLKYSPVFQAIKYIFIWVLGVLILREHISKRRLLGITVILAGIIVFGT